MRWSFRVCLLENATKNNCFFIVWSDAVWLWSKKQNWNKKGITPQYFDWMDYIWYYFHREIFSIHTTIPRYLSCGKNFVYSMLIWLTLFRYICNLWNPILLIRMFCIHLVVQSLNVNVWCMPLNPWSVVCIINYS